MALALEARAMKDDILIGDTPKAKRRKERLKDIKSAGRLWKHSTLADIDGLINTSQIAQSFTFTLVRNPWDRMVSYYHWLRDQKFDHPAVTLSRQLDFSGFLNAPLTWNTFRTTPYAKYMTPADGVEHCSAYIRLEHLAEDLIPLSQHLGFEPKLDVENSSSRQHDYRSYYSDADAEKLGELCAADIDRFGYQFS